MAVLSPLKHSWRDILDLTARNYGIAPPPEWLDRLAQRCEAAATTDAAVALVEREFDHFSIETLDRAIERAARELGRLRQRRRRAVAKIAVAAL